MAPLALGSVLAQEPESRLFENVVNVLQERYYDERFRENVLPGLADKYRARARAASDLTEQRRITHEFLSNIPASHLCLLSEASRTHMLGELTNKDAPTFGFALIEYDGKHYAHNVLEGGPAEKAGLLRGDRIVLIDDLLTGDSPRLDWRTDDAYLPDPPTRFCLGEEGEVIRLHVERRPGVYVDIEVKCELYSAFRAAKASAKIFEHGGRSIAYLHYWFIHMTGVDTLLKDKLEGEFASCDALVFDLRGRGGNGFMVPRILDILDGTNSTWNKPVVALINGLSRSAKDVIAFELRKREIGLLVGETTSGAVVPVTVQEVGHDTHLMFPSFELPRYSHLLEFVGVAPDVVVEEPGVYSAGRDPILRAGLREATRLANKEALLASQSALETLPVSQTVEAVTAGADAQEKPHSARALAGRGGATSEDTGEVTRPLDEDLPVSALLNRMVDAIGGEKALRKHSARTLKGTLAVGGMFEGALTIYAAAPNYFLSIVELQGMGKFSQGFDGEVGWGDDPQRGARILDGRELEKMRIQADIYGLLNYESAYASVEIAGLRKFAGKECYELKLTDKSDNVQFMYVDRESHLIAGRVGTDEGPMGTVKVTSVNEQYEVFHGVKLATRTKQDIGGFQEQTITITDVSVEPHREGTFDLPDSIRKLLGG
jgi:carboxyl-terminal processing protease